MVSSLKKINWKFLLSVILGLIYLLTRFINLTIIPIFVDEAIYTRWTQIIAADPSNNFFIPLSDGKEPLFMWISALFIKFFSNPLVVTRGVSAIAGLFGVWGTYLLAKKLFGKRVGILSAVLFILCPFLLLYNRLAVVDGMMTTFFIFAVYFTYLLVMDLKLKDSILLGLMMGLGVLTKSTAALAIIFIPVSLVFLWNKEFKKIKLVKLLGYWVLSLLIAFLMYRILKFSPIYYLIAQRTPDFIFTPKEVLSHPFDPFLPRFPDVFSWLWGYLTWPVFLSSILGLILILKDQWKKAIFLGIYFLGPLLVEMEIAKAFTPRYFIFIAPFALVLSAFFLDFISNWLVKADRVKFYTKEARYALVAILLIPCAVFEFFLLTNPPLAPIPQVEKSGYLEDWSAGYGITQVADYLKIQAHSGQAITVGTEGVQGYGTLPDGLEVYLRGVKNVSVEGLGQPGIVELGALPDSLVKDAKSQKVYFVINKSRFKDLGNQNLELLASYPKPFNDDPLLFFQVKGD